MCGIAGFISKNCTRETLKKMGDTISHRGPDDTGYYFEKNVGIVQKRLSIIDLENGKQPAYNENKDIAVVFNGEIYNYSKLRLELEHKGHRISNNSDTAVLPHMYEEYGPNMFSRLSGQFAIAVYDTKFQKLVLARDRIGIKPLYFYCRNDEFFYASEIKAILATGRIKRELCCNTLFDVFTFWSPQHDGTIIKDIFSLLPGEYLVYQDKKIYKNKYWSLKYEKTDNEKDFETAQNEVENLISEAVKKRLMGDVKISTYLSGGLDSSLITSIIAGKFDNTVEAFSLGFENSLYDEYDYQKRVCEHLGIKHNVIFFKNSEIPGLIKKCITHIETPLLRTGPIPLYRLSELVNKSSKKVVLSGEGADEIFGGYDIFREVKIRNYLKKYPESAYRKQLFKKVNMFLNNQIQSASPGSLNYFYMQENGDRLLSSHYARWRQFSFFKRFFSDTVKLLIKQAEYPDYYKSLKLDSLEEINRWTDIQKSQYIEIKTFLSQYLLASQGDRIAMGNAVEVRFPFLDDDLVQYSMSLNDRYKIKALNEKYILKKIAQKYLPNDIINRKKFPYRSPVNARQMMSDEYMKYMVSEEAIKKYNIFNPNSITAFLNAVIKKEVLTEKEIMLLFGVLTTQVVCDVFCIETI